jgi:NAD(P)H-hydrate epimerase
MQELERRAVASGVSENSLMETAGLIAARRLAQITDGVRAKRIVILVGPGNNGGDGMVAARYLSEWGALVTLYMATERRRDDKFEDCRARHIRIVEALDDIGLLELASYVTLADVVVDAVLGIGNDRPLSGSIRVIFEEIARLKVERPKLKYIALDVPSGLNADTGDIDPCCFSASVTLTLGAPKFGLYRFPGAAYVGSVEVLNIGLPSEVDADFLTELCDESAIVRLVPKRPLDGHKGTFGNLLVVAGSRRFIGAPVLATTAAFRAGVGLVTLAAPNTASRLAGPALAEQVHLPLAETPDGHVAASAAGEIRAAADKSTALVIGPGLGDVDSVRGLLQALLLTEPYLLTPSVIDADALNALAQTYRWWESLKAPAVLTPHPGEMGRLLGKTVPQVQDDRVATAQQAASEWGQVVVLKGAHTVIASPDGRTAISPFANPALASAGTGDVLSGIIGALLAQGMLPYAAARLGVYVHAAAAERLSLKIGSSGLLASDIHAETPVVMHHLRRDQA